MADQALKSGYGRSIIIIGGAEQLQDSDFEIVQLSVGGNTAKVGDAVTYASETAPAVDLLASGEKIAGIIVAPVLRPSDSWDVDDALVDGTWVKILKPTGGRVKILARISGDSGGTALAAGVGISTINTGLTIGAASGAGHLFAGGTLGLGSDIPNARLVSGETLGDATSAAAGKFLPIYF